MIYSCLQMKLPPSMGQKKTKAIEQVLEELGLGERNVMTPRKNGFTGIFNCCLCCHKVFLAHIFHCVVIDSFDDITFPIIIWCINKVPIQQVDNAQFLGVIIDDNLN